jgi:putative chitinase
MNKANIIRLFPQSLIKDHVQVFDEAFAYANINTEQRIAMYLAQVAHECQHFRRMEENLNYSAKGLANTWPRLYAKYPKAKIKQPNDTAVQIAYKPVEIANRTYANRNGNGDYASGDGWRFRGMGELMTTGRSNYELLDDDFNMNGKIVANPELLIQPYWAVMSAVSYWNRNELNRFADMGADGIQPCRRAINGGLLGLDKVVALYHRIITAL